jgi:outer membrane murein-binding lipoprotein Lpp
MCLKLYTGIFVVAGAVLSGCVSTSDVLEMGKDTYSVSATADGFRSAASARQSAFEAGREMCSKQGKRFMFVNENTSRTRMDIDTTVVVNFSCLSENDPEYNRPRIRQAPNVVIEDQRK